MDGDGTDRFMNISRILPRPQRRHFALGYVANNFRGGGGGWVEVLGLGGGCFPPGSMLHIGHVLA